MQKEIMNYGKDHHCLFDCSSNNYGEALEKREQFLRTHQGKYMSHGGKDIMTGYGSLAQEVLDQIPEEKTITMVCAIGAGGPIGLAAYFQYFPRCKLVVAQSNEFDAFVRSIESGEIEYNNSICAPGLSDGIAVDKPEEHALHLAKQLGVQGISVNSSYVKEIHKRTKLGGSSCISLASLKKFQIETDIVVILDCEGNY
jgi:threonine dehydratase